MKKKTKAKICTLINSRFTYILKVDGCEISFIGLDTYNYFEEHYRSLGYKIIELDESD